MLDTLVPKKIIYLFDLIRFNKPIGFMLLMWPCWFGLAILPFDQMELIYWYILFFFGSFFMRSAGCIINDIVDINLDNKIARTSSRPLTSKKISIYEALIFLLIFLILSFLILIQFKLNSIIIGLLSVPIIIIYPFMKRYTYWPQLILGIVFSWGIIIISTEFLNYLDINFLLLYVSCIFWTLAYDTIYAYQDIKDDVNNGIKSTAILFNRKGRIFVRFCYTVFLVIIGFLGFQSSNSYLSFIVIILFIFGINVHLNKWDLKENRSSNYFFRFNNIIGFICFLYLIIY